ncbi:hypothetical protein C8Q73DRAFT_234286 [Cubamyces lactineus]|nr:hypothetical protein C8Q73DRAFT_234286 [Cubamyces lactineus]
MPCALPFYMGWPRISCTTTRQGSKRGSHHSGVHSMFPCGYRYTLAVVARRRISAAAGAIHSHLAAHGHLFMRVSRHSKAAVISHTAAADPIYSAISSSATKQHDLNPGISVPMRTLPLARTSMRICLRAHTRVVSKPADDRVTHTARAQFDVERVLAHPFERSDPPLRHCGTERTRHARARPSEAHFGRRFLCSCPRSSTPRGL